MPGGRGIERQMLAIGLAALGALSLTAAGAARPATAATPEIRITGSNRVPVCVTPDKLTRFLESGNPSIEPKFRGIARFYKEHGERLRVRWDYAFFQMIIETNYLKFANNNGKGDVSPKQNNFAGIGTTGGGVPGDSFPDVSTGVLGQMQHLVAYSGEPVANPVAPRTRDRQDDIIKASLKLKRPPTFRDLAGRWAVDKKYATSIEFIANKFRAEHCSGREPVPPAPAPSREVVAKAGKAGGQAASGALATASLAEASKAGTTTTTGAAPAAGAAAPRDAALAPSAVRSAAAVPPAAKPAPRAASCTVLTASYGGERNMLIRSTKGGQLQYIALQVVSGQEQQLAAAFVRQHASGGEVVGEFPSRDEALLEAFARCPSAATEVER